MIEQWLDNFRFFLENHGTSVRFAAVLESTMVVSLIFLLALFADYLTKKIIIQTIRVLVKKTANTWDDIFLQRRVFNRLAHIAPALVVNFTIKYLVDEPGVISVIKTITEIYMILIGVLVIDAVINALHEIYRQQPVSKGRSIKGYVQIVKILIYFVAVIFIIADLTGKTPTALLAGLGAVAAIVMLVFKDTILGFVASIQLSANNMVKIGDWIEVPKYQADGTVIDISLHTVKVQNWDKTIVTVPTYSLVSDSFTNWIGMEESGGRRIKRSISIDMHTVRFLDEEMFNRLCKIDLLKDYLNSMKEEVDRFNAETGADISHPVNGRRLTNLGTFRMYLRNYLKNDPKIRTDMTFLVRHLQPTERGLPMEIYVFTRDQKWADYEAVQADIFDHVLAVVPEFGLKVFQNPTGEDFRYLSRSGT
ncbi:MAG: mechanosensitive ion channel family protein [Bacteroidota bacterium]